MKKLLISIIASLSLIGTVLPVKAAEPRATQITGLETRTEEEIARKYEELLPETWSATYAEQPSYSNGNYVAGSLSDETLQEAVDIVNLIRYIAGLPDDVTLNEEYNNLTQHASVLMASLRGITHYPSQPADMPDEFFNLGRIGAGSSNISMGYTSPAFSVLAGYMDDSDQFNLPMMGHRRWVLNPSMAETGFGYCDGFSAMYSFDMGRRASVDYVAWPAAVTPVELSAYTPAFSISFNNSYTVDKNTLKVTIHSEIENKDYVFTNPASAQDYEYNFYVNDGGYGMSGTTVIFLPVDENKVVHRFAKGDNLTITMEGVTKDGSSSDTFSYSVSSFSAEEKLADLNKKVISLELTKPVKTEYVEGEKLDLSGGKLAVSYDNNTSEVVDLSADMISSEIDMNQIGTHKVMVTYKGASTEFEITVKEKTVTGITLTDLPGKTSYIEGDEINPDGGKLLVNYDNGTSETIDLTLDMLGTVTAGSAGEMTVTVTYKGKTTTFNIAVAKREITDVSWYTKPSKTDYVEGQNLDLSGGKLNVTYNNGQSEIVDVTESMISGYDSSVVGKQTVTITYGDRELTFEVNVEKKTVTGIEFGTNPVTEYVVGTAFSMDGVTLLVTYNDGSIVEIPVTQSMYSAPDLSTTGDKSVKVSFEGKEINFTVHVREAEVTGIELSKSPDKVDYIENQKFDPAGGIVTVKYDNGKTEEVDLSEAECIADFSTPGEKTVTIKYAGFETQLKITVKKKSLTSVEWLKEPDEKVMKEDLPFIYSGTVRLLFDNGTSTDVVVDDSNADVVDYDASKPGKQKVTITLSDYNFSDDMLSALSYEVTVEPKVCTGIAFKDSSRKEYVEGQSFDYDNTVLVVTYDNGNSEEVVSNSGMITGFDSTKLGPQTITATYNGMTTSLEVQIVKKAINNISWFAKPASEIKVGDIYQFNASIVLTYNDGDMTTVELNEDNADIELPDTSKPGIQKMNVKLKGMEIPAGISDVLSYEVNVIREGTGTSDGSTGVPPEKIESKDPETGIYANPALWMAVVAVATGCIFVINKKRDHV